MGGKKLSGKQIERMEFLLGYVASEVDNIQKAGVEISIDWHSLWLALEEMRENLGLPVWK